MRGTTPGRLQLFLGLLLTLGVLTGLAAGLAGAEARSGTRDLSQRAQPLLGEAETIYSALADADTTAAQAFLTGGLEPAAMTARYQDDLNKATAALTSAARRTPDGSTSADAVAALSSGTAQYAALVATARADNRQNLPIGASYLAAASRLNRDTLLPEAERLFTIAQNEVSNAYASARSTVWVVLLGLSIVLLAGALLLTQRYLSRLTHRTFNVPLVVASVLLLTLVALAFGIGGNQRDHLRTAEDQGSTPAATLARARILVLRERGDDALALVAHGSGSQYEADFADARKQLTDAGGLLADDVVPSSASTAHQAYLAKYDQVRRLDDKSGDYDGAVKLALSADTTTTFDSVTTGLGDALDRSTATFTGEVDKAGSGLALLAVLGPLLALAMCAFAALGIRARLEEYR